MRVALDIAALGRRGAAETVAGYNALLADREAALAAAGSATEVAYRERHGEACRAAHDDAMTRPYDFFAQPAAQGAFCREARAVPGEVAVMMMPPTPVR